MKPDLEAAVERLSGPGLPSNMALGTVTVSRADLSLVLEGVSSLQPSASVPTEGQSTAGSGWLDIASAPRGCVTDEAGIRGASDWFLGRPAAEFRDVAPPFIVIRRRASPHEDTWECHGGAAYVPRYLDAWRPIKTTTANAVGMSEANEPNPQPTEVKALREALENSVVTLLMLKRNVQTEIRHHDGLFRWEGVPEAIQAEIDRAEAALSASEEGA